MRLLSILSVLIAVLLYACGNPSKEGSPDTTNSENEQLSPNGKVAVKLMLEEGQPFYQVHYNGKPILNKSALGFELSAGMDMTKGFIVSEANKSSFDETWTPVWGETSSIRDNYNQIAFSLKQEESGRKMRVVFKVYDYGIGFRYEIPEQDGLQSFSILNEVTAFNLAADHKTWFLPARPHPDYGLYYNTYERVYETAMVSELDTFHTPVTFETTNGLYLSIHEANLTDYASMTLIQNSGTQLDCNLVPWPDGEKVKTKAGMVSPWRTLQIAEKPGDLITSYLILNLNEPNKIEDTSWIKTMKYIGIWWEMHLGKSSWKHKDPDGVPHGATTENTKRHIDFAAKHNIGGVLVEGWNTGWEEWESWLGYKPTFDFVTPYPDYDLEMLAEYAKEKNVMLISHHETSADVENYEQHIEKAYDLMQELGIHAVKSGYVGPVNPKGQHHHGQYMVNHYRKAVELAAEHQVMIDAHEPIKPTGIRRTYPNMMTREGVRGMEYNAWSEGNPPNHTTILPFTRMLAGPIDYTPGIFDIEFNNYKKDNRVYSTLANQLALYVVIYSPMQMAADLIENYENQPAFAFIEDVATDWDDTKVLHAKIGEYITIARKAKGENTWFLGSITNEAVRSLDASLDFLEEGKQYVATVYADGPDASWEDNPLAITIEQFVVDKETIMNLKLTSGGGQAIKITEADDEELGNIPVYGK